MIVFSTNILADEEDLSLNKGKRLSFRSHNPIYQKIKKRIDLNDECATTVLYEDTKVFRSLIVEELSILLAKKESLPNNATDREIKKWLKKNPREIIEILGKKISIGGKGLMPPLIDREIINYSKLLDIIDVCINANSPLYITIKDLSNNVELSQEKDIQKELTMQWQEIKNIVDALQTASGQTYGKNKLKELVNELKDNRVIVFQKNDQEITLKSQKDLQNLINTYDSNIIISDLI